MKATATVEVTLKDDDVLSHVQDNFKPEQVFSEEQLRTWAESFLKKKGVDLEFILDVMGGKKSND